MCFVRDGMGYKMCDVDTHGCVYLRGVHSITIIVIMDSLAIFSPRNVVEVKNLDDVN